MRKSFTGNYRAFAGISFRCLQGSDRIWSKHAHVGCTYGGLHAHHMLYIPGYLRGSTSVSQSQDCFQCEERTSAALQGAHHILCFPLALALTLSWRLLALVFTVLYGQRCRIAGGWVWAVGLYRYKAADYNIICRHTVSAAATCRASYTAHAEQVSKARRTSKHIKNWPGFWYRAVARRQASENQIYNKQKLISHSIHHPTRPSKHALLPARIRT